MVSYIDLISGYLGKTNFLNIVLWNKLSYI